MSHTIARRILSFALSLSMALSVCSPAVVLAQATGVRVENHTQADGRVTISNVRIDGVAAPEIGAALDGTAEVSADPSVSWEIPVLWVRDDLSLATKAEEGRSYLPALAFYVPEGYAIEGDAYQVSLSDSLTELFGGNEIVSVYNAATAVTYILPASIRDFFGAVRGGEAEKRSDEAAESSPVAAGPSADVSPATAGTSDESTPEEEQGLGGDDGDARQSTVDVYCAQTAKDNFSVEDLEWLIDLIFDRLEPQAVELLLNSFPAFRTASENGEIGTQIGLYIYYLEGDKDGLPEHETASPRSLAYVTDKAVKEEDVYRYCYLMAVNIDDLVVTENEKPVHDANTGKLVLSRDGESVRNLENTLVHELFHAFMDDYNRTGMTGVLKTSDYIFDKNGGLIDKDANDRFAKLAFPSWFFEGSASAVQNVYQYRKDVFDGLRTNTQGKLDDNYSRGTLLDNYLNGKLNGKSAYYDLGFCSGYDGDKEIDNTPSAYVCGYLATLYLSDLVNIKNTGSSAIIIENEKIEGVSMEKLCKGLNDALERMHKGETLDQVIADVSPVDENGVKLYKDTSDFEAKFIKGPEISQANGLTQYSGDGDEKSVSFVVDYLNYVLYVNEQEGRSNETNGSILFPIDEDFVTPLDATKESSSEFYKIVGSNKAVESTVPDSVAFAGGGKSNPDAPAQSAAEDTTAEQDVESSQQAEAEEDTSVAADGDVSADESQGFEQPSCLSADEVASQDVS